MTNERLVRWEEKRREYLGSAIVLIFGLSSASLAFCGALLTQDSVKLGGWRTGCFLAAIVFFILALIASVSVHFTRLQDARTTANIVRADGESMVAGYMERLRSNAERWGRMTWCLLYIQLVTFSVGACFLLVSLWLIFHYKLFPV
jgi:uncharacterized membrane protein YhaH (DUF805 family)